MSASSPVPTQQVSATGISAQGRRNASPQQVLVSEPTTPDRKGRGDRERPPAEAAAALVGVDSLSRPSWAAVDEQVIAASLWTTIRALPAGLAVVVRLVWRASPVLTSLAALLQLASGVSTALGLFATANVFVALLEQGPTPQRVLASLPALLWVLICHVVRALLESATAVVQGVLRPRAEHLARCDLHETVVAVELAAFDDADFDELVRRGSGQGVAAIGRCVDGGADLLSSLVVLVAAVVTAGVRSLAVVADGWAALRVSKLRYESFLETVTRDRRLSIVSRLITSRSKAAELRAVTAQRELVDEHRRVGRQLADEAVRVQQRSTRVRLVGRAAGGVGTGIAYLVLGLLLYRGGMPLALAGAAVVAMRTTNSALYSTMYAVNRLYEDCFYLTLFETLLDQAGQRQRPASDVLAPTDPEVIELRGVSYTYPGQDRPALRDVNLTIRRGEVIALVGENGSGKSTLGRLITGLYLPSEGQVLWDGVDIATVDQRSVHTQIAMIMQEPARWPMTATNNIRIGRLDAPDPTGARWERAVHASGAAEVISQLPARENTMLSREFQGGHDLSGGQWQRLGIARGMYRDAAVLVADEPTAALDARAEHAVFAALRAASGSAGECGPGEADRPTRTTVLVTHRLANVRQATRIVVLDRGRVAECGTHEELMANQGIYAELFALQASAYQHLGR